MSYQAGSLYEPQYISPHYGNNSQSDGDAAGSNQRSREYNDAYAITKTDILVLALCMFGVAVVAYFSLFNQSLRLDEAQSLWQTARSPAGLISIVAQDVHVPLYHILLHFWEVFFGNSVPTARMLSLIFFMLTIPASYALGKEAFGRRVGLFVAMLVTLSPFLNWYGSEARMYSLLLFLTVLNQYFFVRIMKRNTAGAWWGYALSALFGMFSHYFFFLSLLCQAVFFIGYRDCFSKGATKNFLTIAFGLVLAFLPWLAYVAKLGFASTSQPLLQRPTAYNLFSTIEQFMFGFQNEHINSILISMWPIAFLFAFFILRKDRRSGERRGMSSLAIYFLLSALLPIVMVFFVSVLKPIYLTRYLIMTVPALYLLVGWMFATFPTQLARALRVILVMAMLFTFANQTISAQTPVKEDYRDAVNYLTAHASNRDVIVLSAPFTIYPVEYYYRGTTEITTLPIWNQYAHGGIPPYSSDKLPSEVDEVNANHKIAWILLSQDQGYNEKIRMYYDTHYQRIDHQVFSNSGVELYAYKLMY